MEKNKSFVSSSSILVICGTVLAVNGYFATGITIAVLGVLGSIVSFSISYQQESIEREERKQLYENVAKTIGSSIPMWTNDNSGQIH